MESRTIVSGISGVVIGLAIAGAQQVGAAQAPKPMMDAEHQVWSVDKGGEWMPMPDIVPKGAMFKVMHGDPAKGAADFYIKLPAGYAFPLHFHTANERLFVDNGQLEAFGAHGAGDLLGSGGYAFMPAKMPHYVKCVSKTECTIYMSSDGPFDIFLVDEKGNVTRSWSAAEAQKQEQQPKPTK
jgi:hypothetical protein